MAMMACFTLYRLDERAFVFLPGNLAVFAGLGLGALSLGLQRSFWLWGSLLGAAVTAALGLVALLHVQTGLTWMRLPGSPVIWVVVGLYLAFRLGLIYQQQQRKQNEQRRDGLRRKLEEEAADQDAPLPASGAAPTAPVRPAGEQPS